MNCLRVLCSVPFVKNVLAKQFTLDDAKLEKDCLGIKFKNPVALAAGFDKNANWLKELEALGFGCVEIGTVTPKAQPGNDKPRLFRLPQDKALINRMGFNNEGVEAVVKRLKEWQLRITKKEQLTNSSFPVSHSRMIIGGNIGKNKITPNEDAWKDYEICFKALHPYVDYFVVNVSSPNTPGLRELQEKESLRKILTSLQALNSSIVSSQLAADSPFAIHHSPSKPILLKIAPDLTLQQVDDVIDLALEINLDGLVATNTTISRENLSTGKSRLAQIGAGGLSGSPVKNRSTEIVQYIFQKTKGQIPIVASGGIFTGEDAIEKLNAGASLVQVWTGFIYIGPVIVKNICKALLKR